VSYSAKFKEKGDTEAITGKMMNRDYRITATSHNYTIDELRGDDLSIFPVEKARLRSARYLVAMSAVCILGYGWSVGKKMVPEFHSSTARLQN
jgi:hypothetical protein